MSEDSGESGWRPLRRPARSAGADEDLGRLLIITPFMRMARVHGLLAAADGLIAVALAGSIFFSIDPSAARWRVALYLLLTIAPFAVVTPLIGPVIDRARSGRRTMIIATGLGRAVLAFLMVQHIDSILLFPEAFGMLVLQKSYSVAKSAVVPKLVRSEDELVDANARLALLSAIAGMSGAGVGAVFSLGGPDWVCGIAVLVYVAGVIAAFQLPPVAVAEQPPDAEERAELRGRGIVLAASGMGLLRMVVGFLTFLVAFVFRGGEDGVDIRGRGGAVGGSTAILRDVDISGTPSAPAWHFGLVLLGAGVGALIGARVAPPLRRRVAEERILQGGLLLTGVVAGIGAWAGGVGGAFLAALAVAVAAGSCKLAFDAIVQRDAPEANHGRSFARFEARFQLMWATGALVAVLPLGLSLGLTMIAVVMLLACLSYTLGLLGYETPLERTGVSRELRRRLPARPSLPDIPNPLRRRAAETGSAADPTWVAGRPPGPDQPSVPGPPPVPDPTVRLGGVPSPGADTAPSEPAPRWEGTTADGGGPLRPWVSSGEGVEIDPYPPRRDPPEG